MSCSASDVHAPACRVLLLRPSRNAQSRFMPDSHGSPSPIRGNRGSMSGPQCTPDFAGEENAYEEPVTDDWRLVLEYLIEDA